MALELEEIDTQQLNEEINQKPNALRILKNAPNKTNKSDMNTQSDDNDDGPPNVGIGVGIAGTANDIGIMSSSSLDHGHGHEAQSKCGKYFQKSLTPFHIAFKYTIPKCDRESSTPKLSIAFLLVLVWLAILTFICVDSAEKMGNCLKISEDVMGLTILAIGSSLPDCFSSVLAAKQGKGEMAVSNALGSNVFDINICIGVSFLLKSIISGFQSIKLNMMKDLNYLLLHYLYC